VKNSRDELDSTANLFPVGITGYWLNESHFPPDQCKYRSSANACIPPQAKGTWLEKGSPWLAAEKPDVFNALSGDTEREARKDMLAAKHVASFIGHEPGKLSLSALCNRKTTKPLTYEAILEVPAYLEMKALVCWGLLREAGLPCLWFDLCTSGISCSMEGQTHH